MKYKILTKQVWFVFSLNLKVGSKYLLILLNNIINVSYEVVKRIRQKVFTERMNSKT